MAKSKPKPPSILVVDDDEHQRIIIADYLRFLGFDVITAEDGPQALGLAGEKRPDLVLLDVFMPGMGGGQVARALRSGGSNTGVPILFMTAAITPPDAPARAGLEEGDGCIAKPFDLEELAGAVRALLPEA